MTQYLDSGHPLDDAAILRSAVHFTTAQRAFSADLIQSQPLEHLDDRARSYLTVNAFVAEMTAYEDFLAWIIVLEKWSPGDFQSSLVWLLDKTNVNDTEENRIGALAETLTSDDLRQLLHIPSDENLEQSGFLPEHRNRITTAMSANVDGIRRVVALRKRDSRALVQAYNKIKHQFLAVPTVIDDLAHVLVPKFQDFDAKHRTVGLKRITIATDPATIRLHASRAIVSQAVLNSLLGVILWARYGEQYLSPPWAVRALALTGWTDDSDQP